MEADFSGWATKAGLRCSDGRTIMPNAFQHQDTMQVPLVWQHGHNDPDNVLGHAILENRPEGVYAYGYFNNTPKAKQARELVEHKDVTMMSIWANQLIEKSKQVLHGVIREVSLVLSGANPGAKIENITIRHDGLEDDTVLEDEAIIWTGTELEHADGGSSSSGGEKTIQDVYDSLTEEQKQVVHFLIGQALESAGGGDGQMAQSGVELDEDASVQDVYDSLTDIQRDVLHFMVGEALSASETDTENDSKGAEMGAIKHNVFENGSEGGKPAKNVLSHSEIEGIVQQAGKLGSLKAAVEEYGIKHGIEDLDVMFPDAQLVNGEPEWYSRRMEWVQNLLSGVRKSPFGRIKTLGADITAPEARAKGYIKGNLKKEEFFKVSKRVTTPTTVYKKQKLDRDDIIDISDFDVVVWLKGEMRLMLDEEIARAILVGDGRPADDEDKIDEERIRPIATDHELYTTTVTVNIDDTNSSFTEVIDALVRHRSSLRGTGLPTMYTTEAYIARAMLLKDSQGRDLYRTLDEVATKLRVKEIVAVEVLEEQDDIVCILVNPTDYVVGASRGGAVSLFDDFDIDYNQYKYLIETRMCGALVKFRSALVVRKTAGSNQLIAPNAPAFNSSTGNITITDQTGVVYRRADTDAVVNAAGSPYHVADGTSLTITAEPASGYYFESSENDEWTYTNPA